MFFPPILFAHYALLQYDIIFNFRFNKFWYEMHLKGYEKQKNV